MGVTHKLGGGWGDAIDFASYDQRRVYGWKTPLPKPGDLLECPMKSGRIGVYRFSSVEPQRDPPDMFFGKVEDVGFKDELEPA